MMMFRQPQLFSILPRTSNGCILSNNHTKRSSLVSLVSPNSGSSTILGCASSNSTTSTTRRTFGTTSTSTTTPPHHVNRRDMPFQHFSRGRRNNTIRYPSSPPTNTGSDGGQVQLPQQQQQQQGGGGVLSTSKFKIPRKRASKLFHELNVEKCEEDRKRNPDVFHVPFRVGDAIEVTQVAAGGVHSKDTEQIRGVVLGIRNRGLGSVFYLRDVLFGEPVERIVPLHSPMIQKIEILQRNFVKAKEGKKIKRAKLFYLRDRNPALCRVTKVT